MGPGSGEVKNQLSAVDLVDQQPVRRDVALPAPDVVPAERVVLVLRRQGLLLGQQINDPLHLAGRGWPAASILMVSVSNVMLKPRLSASFTSR